jgi:hypothetical protein
LGKAFELASVNYVGGTATLAFLEKTKPDFYQRILEKLSQHFRITFSVDFRNAPEPMPNLEGWLVFQDGKAYLAARSVLLGEEVQPAEWIAAYSKVIELGGLPVKLGYANGDYFLRHASQGQVFTVAVSKGSPIQVVGGTLPGATTSEALGQFRKFVKQPGLKAMNAGWGIHEITHAPDRQRESGVLSLWRKINSVGFPKGPVECNFSWHLKNYSFYKEMPAMTKLLGEAATQSLLDFEFGEAKQCQLAALCNKKGQYRLVFSFDGDFDHEELANLLKLKLKEYE